MGRGESFYQCSIRVHVVERITSKHAPRLTDDHIQTCLLARATAFAWGFAGEKKALGSARAVERDERQHMP